MLGGKVAFSVWARREKLSCWYSCKLEINLKLNLKVIFYYCIWKWSFGAWNAPQGVTEPVPLQLVGSWSFMSRSDPRTQHCTTTTHGLYFCCFLSPCHPGTGKSPVTFLTKAECSQEKRRCWGLQDSGAMCCGGSVTTGYVNNAEGCVEDSTHSPAVGKNWFSCISFRETTRLVKMIN